MATEVLFPKIGFTMNEGEIQEWFFEDGETVSEGEALLVIESDKAAHEIEAPASGILKILAPDGATIEVGTIIARIE